MTFIRFAAVVLLAAFLSLSPARAQDHSAHDMSAHDAQTMSPAPATPPAVAVKHDCAGGQCLTIKKGKKCPMGCCDAGECPMMKAGKSCACCGSGREGKMTHDTGAVPVAESVPVADQPWEKESARTMATMHKNMARPYTGDADADFVRGMIPHHEGAVEMARTVLKYGDDEQAKGLARRIIVAQKGEIAWMQKWLRERQIPQTGPYDFNR